MVNPSPQQEKLKRCNSNRAGPLHQWKGELGKTEFVFPIPADVTFQEVATAAMGKINVKLLPRGFKEHASAPPKSQAVWEVGESSLTWNMMWRSICREIPKGKVLVHFCSSTYM